MRISVALAFIVTISQGLVAIAAPSKSNPGAVPFDLPEKVNYDEYHKAIMRANNLTAADFAPTRAAYEAAREGEMSVRAAPYSVSTIFCVGVAPNPIRMHIFTDINSCTRQGWNSNYAFVSYTQKNAVASKPWVACQSHSSGHILFPQEKCPNGMAQFAKGYANKRDTGSESFILTAMANGQGYMFAHPFWKLADFSSDGNKFTYKHAIRHLAVMNFAGQAKVDEMTKHVKAHPHLYKRISEYNTFTNQVAFAAQVLIDNLRDLQTRRTQPQTNLEPGSGFAADLQSFNMGFMGGRFLVRQHEAHRDTDGTYRHAVNLYYQANNGQWQWMGGITVPSDYLIIGGTVRTAFTEALRDHTTVRVERSSHGGWLMMPLPPYVNGPLPLPPMGPIYGPSHGR